MVNFAINGQECKLHMPYCLYCMYWRLQGATYTVQYTEGIKTLRAFRLYWPWYGTKALYCQHTITSLDSVKQCDDKHFVFAFKCKHIVISCVAFKGKPNREIIFTNIHESGVCNISITTTPFVIWMLSHVSLSGIEWPRIPNFLTKCVINTVWATFIIFISFNARLGIHIGCKEWPVRLC